MLDACQVVHFSSTSDEYMTVNTALSRILAAKPHGADVERLISASNNLKSPGRSRMSVETENLYLFVHYNLPPLYAWDPRPAAHYWMTRHSRRVQERRHGKKQQYFRGMFVEASAVQSDDEKISDSGKMLPCVKAVAVKAKKL